MSDNHNGKTSFSAMEERVLEFWDKQQTFQASITKTAPQGDYVFYDGPPFATGTPHYGHIVASLMKDAVPRFWTMRGYRVERKWGWDCHGLPIENIVEKELGSKSKKDIEAFGVDKFNEACQARVLGYVEDWRKVVRRLGRWVDMDNAYKTMDLNYMETVWWAFKQLWDKGLIYEGYRSMHICPRCETTLSQSEVAEGYRDVKDLSAIAKFKLLPDQQLNQASLPADTYVLAWTTTPWTLVANVALAVGAEIDYVLVKFYTTESLTEGVEYYFMAKAIYEAAEGNLLAKKYQAAVGQEAKAIPAYEALTTVKGEQLVGLRYQPLYQAYANNVTLTNHDNGWQVVAADFVTTTDGTGVVHIAPAFGEDDMNLGKTLNLPFVQHVGMDGRIKEEAGVFAGLSVKPEGDTMATDVEIIKDLAGRGLLFDKAKYEHSYPHCWRCDTPLLNYATSSWFVKVTDLKTDALASAEHIHWSPEHIKEGRFGQWLAGARDWSISRQRFWASVLPIWRCDCGQTLCVGSIAELKALSGVEVSDLHKHVVDKVEFPCASCGAQMKRIPDVLDCWFESGSMPYAQHHYPFDNKDYVERNFPAEFIAEGVDQTRAWFYYLHVISNGLYGKHAFKNVIVNGIVLAEDGKKMSKKLKNYPDPSLVLEKYGADALRLYLLASPVMQAENLNFSEKGVEEALRKNVMLLWNVYNFYATYATDEQLGRPAKPQVENVLDLWILAKLSVLTAEVTKAMEQYQLPKAVRPLTEFIDEFSTWYLRRSRDRLRESAEAVATMRYVLAELAKLMAPFAPFIAESLWQAVTGFNYQQSDSVHLESWSEPSALSELEQAVLADMTLARRVVELGLAKRDEVGIKIRQPLPSLSVAGCQLSDNYLSIIEDELNVKKVACLLGSQELSVVLDTTISPELKAEGLERDLVRQINMLRKNAGLTVNDHIIINLEAEADLVAMLESRRSSLLAATVADELYFNDVVVEATVLKLDGRPVKLAITKK